MGAHERRMAILHTLCRQREITSEALAKTYKVTSRTIRTDLSALSRVYPIVSVVGRNGCYRLADWKELNNLLLTADEMQLLFRLHAVLSGDDALLMSSIINKVTNLPYAE